MQEMEGFFGVVINMGLIELPELEAYWSTNWTGHFLDQSSVETVSNKSFGCSMSVKMTLTARGRKSIK
jgi:hypothetical protein